MLRMLFINYVAYAKQGDNCDGHPLVKQVVTLSFDAKVDLADF